LYRKVRSLAQEKTGSLQNQVEGTKIVQGALTIGKLLVHRRLGWSLSVSNFKVGKFLPSKARNTTAPGGPAFRLALQMKHAYIHHRKR